MHHPGRQHNQLSLLGDLRRLENRRKEFAEGEGPQRTERAGASESLGQSEDTLSGPASPPFLRREHWRFVRRVSPKTPSTLFQKIFLHRPSPWRILAQRGARPCTMGISACPGFPKPCATRGVMTLNHFLAGYGWNRSAGVLAGFRPAHDPGGQSRQRCGIGVPRAGTRKTLPPKFSKRSNSVKFWSSFRPHGRSFFEMIK